MSFEWQDGDFDDVVAIMSTPIEGIDESVPVPQEEDDWDDFFEDEDGEDLLAALDAALDEVEEEQRIEEVREIASPTHDRAEMSPTYESAYQSSIRRLMGERSRPLPTPMEARRKAPVLDAGLNDLLQGSLERERRSMEHRRAHPWHCSQVLSARGLRVVSAKVF